MPDIPSLIRVMEQVRERLAAPDADFSWSSWADSEHALSEVDHVIQLLKAETVPSALLNVLFAPTGPIQEVAISSGWGDEFLVLADQLDSALER